MRWTEKRSDAWSGPYWEGKKKKHHAQVDTVRSGRFYFTVDCPDHTAYNSLWENKEFATLEEGQIAAEKWIDDNAKKVSKCAGH